MKSNYPVPQVGESDTVSSASLPSGLTARTEALSPAGGGGEDYVLRGSVEATALANALSDALSAALAGGLSPDVACSVCVAVAGDYWREHYHDPVAGLAVCLEARP